MKIKVLYNDSQSLKECLEGKKRIMTYGAGVWADTIKKMLKENGYSLDYAIVDDAYYANCGNVIQQGGVLGLFQWKSLFRPAIPKRMPSFGQSGHRTGCVSVWRMTRVRKNAF